MSSITIRGLEPEVKARLRVRAAESGVSMEQEARDILRDAVMPANLAEVPTNLAEAVRELFQPLGGVELEIPERETMREPPKFS